MSLRVLSNCFVPTKAAVDFMREAVKCTVCKYSEDRSPHRSTAPHKASLEMGVSFIKEIESVFILTQKAKVFSPYEDADAFLKGEAFPSSPYNTAENLLMHVDKEMSCQDFLNQFKNSIHQRQSLFMLPSGAFPLPDHLWEGILKVYNHENHTFLRLEPSGFDEEAATPSLTSQVKLSTNYADLEGQFRGSLMIGNGVLPPLPSLLQTITEINSDRRNWQAFSGIVPEVFIDIGARHQTLTNIRKITDNNNSNEELSQPTSVAFRDVQIIPRFLSPKVIPEGNPNLYFALSLKVNLVV